MRRIIANILAVLSLASMTIAPVWAAADKPLVIETGKIKQLPSATTLQLQAPTTGAATVNLPHGTAPTSPTNGDCWTTTGGLYCQINGATVGPYGTGGGGGGTGGAETLISEVVTAGSQTTVTFSSIAATYRDLVIVVRGRGTAALANVRVTVQFNSDTAANYDRMDSETNGAGVTAGQVLGGTAIDFGYLGAASAPTNTADGIRAQIFDYRGTTFQKALTAQSTLKAANTSGNIYAMATSGWWRSTAAITTVTIGLSSGAFVNGSVVSLYGRA